MTEIFHLCVSATDDLMVSCQYNRWPVWCHVSTTDNRCNVVSVEQIDNPRYMSVQQLGDARYISATDDPCDISVQQMTCAMSYQCNRWPVPYISATYDMCHIVRSLQWAKCLSSVWALFCHCRQQSLHPDYGTHHTTSRQPKVPSCKNGCLGLKTYHCYTGR